MTEKKSKQVYAIRKFTKPDGSSSRLGEEIKGSASYISYLINNQLVSDKKPK